MFWPRTIRSQCREGARSGDRRCESVSVAAGDGERISFGKGDVGYIRARRIHDAHDIEACQLVYAHKGPLKSISPMPGSLEQAGLGEQLRDHLGGA